uniref:Uncharacterized protein n=1 Tax=Cacopsylla melanoneura TaxID=428564 RepID=A0A8D8UNH1_9HEMI
MLTSISSYVLLISCILQLTLSCSPFWRRYQDTKVILYEDASIKKQVNLYPGDLYLVDVTLRKPGLHEYVDISRINVAQSIRDVSEDENVTFELERIENYVYNVTYVYPVSQLGGRNHTVVSASDNPPNRCLTRIWVRNSRSDILSNKNIRKIVLISYGIFSDPPRVGNVRIEILPSS